MMRLDVGKGKLVDEMLAQLRGTKYSTIRASGCLLFTLGPRWTQLLSEAMAPSLDVLVLWALCVCVLMLYFYELSVASEPKVGELDYLFRTILFLLLFNLAYRTQEKWDEQK